MKKFIKITVLLLIINSSFLIKNSSAQSGWQLQTPPRMDEFYSVYFINNYTGWIAATNGTFLKTTNAGVNWVLMPNLPNWNITSVQFLNESTGWTAGSTATLMKTTNGGVNWFNTSCPECTIADDFFDLQFLNENTGFAMGDQSIFKSTDTGLNWVKLHGNNADVFKGYFINTETGWTAGNNGISKTTNGGINWIYIPVGSNHLKDVFFKDENTGWCISSYYYSIYEYGIIYKSTNGGMNWTFLYQDSTKLMYSVYFTGYDTGWVIGRNLCVLKTTNGGNNWFQQNVPDVGYFSIFMLSSLEGWIVGDQKILYTNDGGGSVGINSISRIIPDNFSLSQNYPNPFNSQTTIEFDIKKKGNYSLVIYDCLGRKRDEVFNEHLNAGSYSVSFNGDELQSGVYFYRLSADGNVVDTKKMVLIK